MQIVTLCFRKRKDRTEQNIAINNIYKISTPNKDRIHLSMDKQSLSSVHNHLQEIVVVKSAKGQAAFKVPHLPLKGSLLTFQKSTYVSQFL